MVLRKSEFFVFETEVWLRDSSGRMWLVQMSDYELINTFLDLVSRFYPEAYAALTELYNESAMNPAYYRYKMFLRFIKCNFSNLDIIPDITEGLKFVFEPVQCPLRGECKYDKVICRPKFAHALSPAETRVMAMVYDDLSEKEIADRLNLSPLTVHTHVRNAYIRLGVHSKAEFVKYAASHNLFS